VLPAQQSLFRTAALKQLNGPEDLDRLVRVTNPIGWVAGFVLAVMIGAVLVWSVVGHLPSRVSGNGLLLPQGGRVVEVQSRGAGVLTALLATVGDKVRSGQVVARLGETEGERDLAALRAQLADRQRDLATTERGAEDEQRARNESLARQRAANELRARIARARAATLGERLATSEALFREQLITRPQLIAVQNELAATQQELSNAASEAARLGSEEIDMRRAAADRIRERQRAVAEIEQRMATLEANLGDQLTLRASADGTVVEVRSQPGALVRQGQAVLALEQAGDGLEVVAFVSSQNGKRLKPGMEARVALASARREEFGMLQGEVSAVSDFPLSFDALRSIIQNEDLARSFMTGGPPFLVRVRLLPDPGSASGYRWTSRRGDEIAISSGIPTSVEIVTEKRRPIALLVPALRGMLTL
jgi:HlyD family secretion protein